MISVPIPGGDVRPPESSLVNPKAIEPPKGYGELVATYGSIRDYIKEDGTLRSSWVRERAAYVFCPWDCRLSWDKDVRVKRFQVHAYLREDFEFVIQKIHSEGLGRLLPFYGGGFAFRAKRGIAGQYSVHSFLAAWDFNPETNELGEIGDMDPKIVEIFELNGYTWGGRFSRPDWMHFQKVRGY